MKMELSNIIMFWATVLSPIVGVIAIIVALVIAHQSSKDTQKQITGIYDLLEVFVAAQNPSMIESKEQYEQKLDKLNSMIREAEIDLQTVHYPFYGRGARIDDIEADMENEKRREHLQALLNEKKEVERRLKTIYEYLKKAGK